MPCTNFDNAKFDAAKSVSAHTKLQIQQLPILVPSTAGPTSAWLHSQITVDKMAEQQQMVLFIRQLLASLIRELENGNSRSGHLDSVAYRTYWLYNCLVRYLGVNDAISDQLVSLVRDARDLLDVLLHQNTASHSYRVEQVFSGGRGRPKFDVSREQLEFLLERGFSIPDEVKLLGLSLRTTERRLKEFGISSGQFFAAIDDQTLDCTVETILVSFPSYDYRRMTGALLSRGIRVQQTRIRKSMRRVNPEGVLLRALTINTINRRRYSVYATLALWHIDGNHKLIRLVSLVVMVGFYSVYFRDEGILFFSDFFH